MKYIMIGFLMAIGWTWGEAVCTGVAKTLLGYIQRSDWYQEHKPRRSRTIEEYDDLKVVKNQIGFR